MALTVETGSGSATADSYVSVADAETYMTNYGRTPASWPSVEATKEEHLRVATQYIDNHYRGRWKGIRSQETQALAWPREGVVDEDGFSFDYNQMPTVLVEATIEAAIRSVEGDSLLGDLDKEGTVKREKVKVGPIEEDITYSDPSSQQPEFPRIDKMLDGLLDGGAEGGVVKLTRV